MPGETRTQQIEAAIAAADASGRPWTNLTIYTAVGGSYHQLAQYLKARRAATRAPGAVAVLAPEAPPPRAPAPASPLAEARTAWVHALEKVAAFDKRPAVRDRAAQAAHQAQHAVLARQLQGAETRWRPLEMQARNALATFLASQAQRGRGNPVEQARCEDACHVALAELGFLVGPGAADPLAEVQALLTQPTIEGKPILPPLT